MQTVLLGLNEINFDYVQHYAKQGLLPTFNALLSKHKLVITKSESEYELQEPWIQWVTVHSGLTYSEHKVYRLGDIVDRPDVPQLFEQLEKSGHSVGAVSPFNAANRLEKPFFFIPDPWTQTPISGDGLTQAVFESIRKMVNENAEGKTSIMSLAKLLLGVVTSVPLSRWPAYFQNVLQRNKPGIKAVILDSLLADIFIKAWKKSKPDFAMLFLNSGAHIQHHYLFNSAAYDGNFTNPDWYCKPDHDPLLLILKEYDQSLAKILKAGDINLILLTALHQKPHGALTYYWRPKKHSELLKALGLNTFSKVTPRMSRDFLIEFNDESDANEAEKLLTSYEDTVENSTIFTVDNRGKSLFVELTYSNDISDNFSVFSQTTDITLNDFKAHVSFVAIKNGEHDGDGYMLSNKDLSIENTIPLESVCSIIKNSVSAN